MGLEGTLIRLRKDNELLREDFKSKEDECREVHKLVKDMAREQEKPHVGFRKPSHSSPRPRREREYYAIDEKRANSTLMSNTANCAVEHSLSN